MGNDTDLHLHDRRTKRGPRRWRFALASLPLALAAVACASGGSTQTGAGTSTQPAPTAPAKPCDQNMNTVGFYDDARVAGTLSASGPMDHSHGDMAGMDHSHNSTGTSKPMDMSGGLGEVEAARVIIKLNEMNDRDYNRWLSSLNPNRSSAAPDDTGMGGHLGPQTWTEISDPAVCQQLTTQLDQAKAVAKKYPKASDAMKDGYVLVAPYLSGIASHWMKFSLVDSKFDVNQPEMLLFDGNDSNANLVGLSYFIRSRGDAEPTDGFAGGNDHYHRHDGLCVSEKGVIGDSTTSEDDCKALGGRKQNGASGWMSHAWIVPGCESPWGVFSAQNPILDQPLVQKSGEGAPCSGSAVKSRWNLEPAQP
jgi:hypothetical protein